MDNLSPEQRSMQMSLVRSKDTKPELRVRSLVHGLGYRYRLHRVELPGKPDLVFPSKRKIIFVHGCFWHGHDCRLGRMPKSRIEYWQFKIANNRVRDRNVVKCLHEMGWQCLAIWECELRDHMKLAERIRKFLES
ncbi:MAG: DNA mismatch endonuclease Vsr [Syntrophobacteraceae bacterium]|nr:DNA mismatch endonuclease Vsr [Syntrophobacteraceae bacterium]